MSVNPVKIHLMAAPCTGKTTFVDQNEFYENVKVVDFARITRQGNNAGGFCRRLVSRLCLVCPFLRFFGRNTTVLKGEAYYEKLFSFLLNESGPVATLGRRGPDDLSPYSDITFAAVLIPVEEHRRHCSKRRQTLKRSRWGDFANVQLMRKRLEEYANERGIPIYESFAAALTHTLTRFPQPSAAEPDRPVQERPSIR